MDFAEPLLSSLFPAELQKQIRNLERFRALLGQNGDFIFLVEAASGVIVDVSESACQQLGYGREELLGKPLRDLVTASGQELLAELFGGAATECATGGIVATALRDRYGEVRPVAMSARLASYEGATYAVLVVRAEAAGGRGDASLRKVIDPPPEAVQRRIGQLEAINQRLRSEIDRLREVEKELKGSEERLKILFQFAPDGYYLMNLKGEIVDANRAIEKITGYSKEELIGKDFVRMKLLPAEQIPKAAAILAENLPGRLTDPNEFTCNRKDGRTVAIEVTNYLTRIKDQALVLGIARDVSKRKRAELALKASEERYRMVFNHSPLGIMHFDENGVIVDCNDQFVEIMGSSRESIVGFNMITKMTDMAMRSALLTALSGKNGYYEGAYRSITGNKLAQLRAVYRRIETEEGKFLGAVGIFEDITERKCAEEALETERRRLFALLEGLPALVYLQAPDHTLRFANRHFREHFGDPEGRFCYQVLHGCQEPCTDCPTLRCFDTKRPRRWDWTSDAGKTFQIYDYPFADVDGSPLALILGIDITDRKQAEDALRESEAKYMSLVENSLTGFTIEQHGRIVFANSRIAAMYGYSGEELIGMEFWRLVHPDDRPLVQEMRDQRLAGEEAPSEYEARGISKHGATLWIRHLNSVIEYHGAPAILANHADLTEHREADETVRASEARYRAIVEDQTELLSRFLADGTLTFVNDTYCRFFGERREDLLGRRFWHHLPEKEHARLRQHIASLTPENPVASIEHWVVTGDARVRWQRWTDRAIYDEQGCFLEYQSVGRDITEQRRAEEALRESERRLRFLSSQLLAAQEKERKRISSELHDELGQALTVMKLRMRSAAKRLRADQDDLRGEFAGMLGYVDEIIENVRRLSRDLSPSILENLGLSAALRWLVEEFSKHHQVTGAVSTIDLGQLFSQEAQILIYRIFQEALTNIAKHAHAGDVHISIEKLGSYVYFQVEDNGIGFDVPEILARDGTQRGLGLAAIDERVNMLGGSLEIHSEKGLGTWISFKVPLTKGGNRS
jgi:PAS domain S-box-containing protein